MTTTTLPKLIPLLLLHLAALVVVVGWEEMGCVCERKARVDKKKQDKRQVTRKETRKETRQEIKTRQETIDRRQDK